ncbi:MAG: hypothetical protein RLP02_06490 [Coleofasciculus sp. C2-GNP5-27]
MTMLCQSYPPSAAKMRPLSFFRNWTILVLLLLWCTSCSFQDSDDIKLTLNAQAAGRPGLYTLSGTTNLPDQSQITVAAIRDLRFPDQAVYRDESYSPYSILDRQVVRVEDGKWQATLNLWQVAPDGHFREAWQLDESPIGESLQPSSEVSFVALFDPQGQLPTAENQTIQTPELEGQLVRFTNEGQPYVKVTQSEQIPLPTGRKTPPVVKPEDRKWGWGTQRYELPPESPAPKNVRPPTLKTEQTNQPLLPSEFLR